MTQQAQIAPCLYEVQLHYKVTGNLDHKVTSSDAVAKLLDQCFNPGTFQIQEEFIILLLNRANNLIGWSQISRGGMSQTVVDPKLIFMTALKAGASAIILAHNHPSGNLNPSEADKALTNRVIQAGKLLEVTVLDHVIKSHTGHFSFADHGFI